MNQKSSCRPVQWLSLHGHMIRWELITSLMQKPLELRIIWRMRGGTSWKLKVCLISEVGLNLITVTRNEVKYSCCPNKYTLLYLTLFLRRKPHFYLVNLIIPTSIITLIAIIGFFTTSSASGMREEKVSLGITTLLSMSILMLMVSDQMPTTSTFIPLIGEWELTGQKESSRLVHLGYDHCDFPRDHCLFSHHCHSEERLSGRKAQSQNAQVSFFSITKMWRSDKICF